MSGAAGVVRLGPGDADRYAALRGEMLLDTPWAFLSSPGDDPGGGDRMRDTLRSGHDAAVYAIACPEAPADISSESGGLAPLVAAAGVLRSGRVKQRHRAMVWGVYTTPRCRGRGYAGLVVSACIAHARAWDGVDVIALSVSAKSHGARRVYEKLGFVAWGREPAAMRIEGEDLDEIHLSMPLRG